MDHDLPVSSFSVFLGHEHTRGPILNRSAMHRETEALLARLGDEGISPMAPVTALRPAQQQLVSMARALSHSVKLLILDEPSAVLDDVEVEALFDVVRRLTAEGVGPVLQPFAGDRVPARGEGAADVGHRRPAQPRGDVVPAHAATRRMLGRVITITA